MVFVCTNVSNENVLINADYICSISKHPSHYGWTVIQTADGKTVTIIANTDKVIDDVCHYSGHAVRI